LAGLFVELAMGKKSNVSSKGDWLKLYRKIENSWFWGNPKYIKFWLYLLIHASHQNNRNVTINGVHYKISRGELVTTRSLLATKCGFSRSYITKVIKLFVYHNQISVYSEARITRIYIQNYDDYQ
jgi:hypothetical protein